MLTRLARPALAACLIFATAHAAAEADWFAGERPTPLAIEALALLQAAPSHGLVATDYASERLLAALRSPAPDPAQRERLSAQLDAAFERYLKDLHGGRLPPALRPADHRPTPFDAAAALREARARGRLQDAIDAAVPPLPQYQELRTVLARLQALEPHPAWATALPPVPGRKLEPGARWAGLPRLRERLLAWGDLQAPLPQDAVYDSATQDGVRRFQERHGLAPDGVIGRATLAALEVRPAARARQVALSIERLRWTPLLASERRIVINVPEFVLRAYEVRRGQIVLRLSMKVIVGRAMRTATPLFAEDMRFIEFSPYWNVPPSIARSETLPKLRADPAYLEREGFEFVSAQGVSTEVSEANLAAVARGEARIRQRPGPHNALGDIKFVFPNQDNIYLHHTPSVRLFERERRDFSHGCIRVEQPVQLAAFVLEHQPGWDEDRIVTAMTAGKSSTLRLAQALPVLITYATAIVKDGRPHFFEDIYGHDARLAAALAAPRPPLVEAR